MADLSPTLQRVTRLAAAAYASAQVAADDRQARDAAIEQAGIEGFATTAIAHAAGLSQPRVQVIITRKTAERQARLTREIGL